MCSPDTLFKHFQDCLDAEVKRLTGLEVGSNIKEGQASSEDEENKLWKLGLLGYSSPRVNSVGQNGFSDWQEFFTLRTVT